MLNVTQKRIEDLIARRRADAEELERLTTLLRLSAPEPAFEVEPGMAEDIEDTVEYREVA